MDQPTRYVVAIDDSGRSAISPSTDRRCFFVGGIILPVSQLERLRSTWTAAHKTQDEEVKAASYASALGLEAHPTWAEGLLSVEMNHWDALPLWLAFDKAEAGPDITLPTRRGGRRINVSTVMIYLAATLAAHLEHVSGCVVAIRIDEMASTTESDALQTEWRTVVGQLSGKRRQSLPPELTFVDSKLAPEIQVADVLMGLIRAAHEAGRPIAPGLGRLLRQAEARWLRSFHCS